MRERHALPVTCDLRLIYASSLTIALVMTVASGAGLLYPERLYPTADLLESSLPNDVVNLAVGLPLLLFAMWLTWRGRLIGLLLWPGALLYAVYNAIAYVFSLPPNVAFVLSLALLALSIYTTISLVACVDGPAVKHRLEGAVRERLTGGVLAGLGTAFAMRATIVIIQAAGGGQRLPAPELAVSVADILVSPTWVMSGILLWRHRPLGYATAAALLFQTSSLFIGVIGFVLLQPVMTEAPFRFNDVVVLSAMGLIAFVPTVLFLRGVASKE